MAKRIFPRKPMARKKGKNPRGQPFRPFAIELRPRFFSGRGTPDKPYSLTPYALERHRQRELTEAEALYLARKSFSHQLRNLDRVDVTKKSWHGERSLLQHGDEALVEAKKNTLAFKPGFFTQIKPLSFRVGPKGNTRTVTFEPDYERLERVLLRYRRMKRKWVKR